MKLAQACTALAVVVGATAFSVHPTGLRRASAAPSALRRTSARAPTALAANAAPEVVELDVVVGELNAIRDTAGADIAAASTPAAVQALKVSLLGKKSPVQAAMKRMRELAPADKPKLGAVVNSIKQELEAVLLERKEAVEGATAEAKATADTIDVTAPGTRRRVRGARHPISLMMEKATDVFRALGYDAVTDSALSPEVETEYYCFEALNCPADHPSRDMQDTFYLPDQQLLRTHTSAVQIRQMEKLKPPFKMVAPGRVYRKDTIDATHSPVFHQVEILAVDEIGKLHLGHLKGTVEHFLKEMFGDDIKVRYRGSFFPFTEPSLEVDVWYNNKWLEVLGCGMVDPRVLEMAGHDPTKYSGFAAGFGVERFAMVIHEIPDIRLLYEGDRRFLEQFPSFPTANMGVRPDE